MPPQILAEYRGRYRHITRAIFIKFYNSVCTFTFKTAVNIIFYLSILKRNLLKSCNSFRPHAWNLCAKVHKCDKLNPLCKIPFNVTQKVKYSHDTIEWAGRIELSKIPWKQDNPVLRSCISLFTIYTSLN